jgi:transposase
MSFDEIAIEKGHDDFVLVIGAPEEGYVVDVLSDRRKETLEAWLDGLSDRERAVIQVACMDMWEPYSLAIEAKLPGVEIVVDRFHVMKNLNHCLTLARREVQREAPAEVKEQLKGSRWALVKNQADLTEEQRQKLDLVYTVSPELAACHQLKEQFRTIFETTTDREEAKRRLEDWIKTVESLGVKALQSFLTTLRNWFDYILNYFHERWNNGFAEGRNEQQDQVDQTPGVRVHQLRPLPLAGLSRVRP